MKARIKKVIKKIIPSSIIRYLKKVKNLISFKRIYKEDYKRFKKNAFTLVKKANKKNLKAEISLQAHRLEKGLSYPDFREGFGAEAYQSLISCMRKYKDNNFDLGDIVYQTGVSVINEYIKRHDNTKIDTTYLQEQLKLLKHGDIREIGGTLDLKFEDINKYTQSDFKTFLFSRHSVRDFSTQDVSLSKINNALEIAGQTPSACNKQPWFTYVIKNQKVIKEIMKIKGPLSGEDDIKCLLLVTTDNDYLLDFSERKQGFIDAGMYASTLLYALHHQNLATCPINARTFEDKDNKVRKILNIPKSQDFIFFIAVGNYLDEFRVTKSKRDDYNAKTRVIN